MRGEKSAGSPIHDPEYFQVFSAGGQVRAKSLPPVKVRPGGIKQRICVAAPPNHIQQIRMGQSKQYEAKLFLVCASWQGYRQNLR